MTNQEISKSAFEAAVAEITAMKGKRPIVDTAGLVGVGGVSRFTPALGSLGSALSWDRAVKNAYAVNLANKGLRIVDFKVVAA